jgi:hypothetical protein
VHVRKEIRRLRQRRLVRVLRAGGAPAAAEAVEGEQAARGRDERAGGVAAPAPARPPARFLDQRFGCFGVGRKVGDERAVVV